MAYHVIINAAHVRERKLLRWFDISLGKDCQQRLVDIGFVDVARIDFTIWVATVILQK